ncbi:hypothetical protein [Actinokineospora iranica]|uniref:Uncharacterized protein n=1 Tax=Actinokineospora iranica TaxID=1271860 RepID=A0A1G6U3D6_9PSEU|nr:hypothetical protein [Actinokineospora iranica]SDD35813.1 hypothetical protein SAMN05216174_11085 [Actinokineospora iranica]
MIDHRSRRSLRLLATTIALGVAPLLAACGDDDTPDPGADVPGVPTTTTVQPGQSDGDDGQDAGAGYFADDKHVGRQVTVTAPVKQDLTDESVVLDASDQGDDTLLVLFKGEQADFGEGTTVTVTGTVQRFAYDKYSGEYGLAEAALFETYADEEFLLADTITRPGAATPTS